MDGIGDLILLLLGPAGGVGLYVGISHYYRNDDKSHDYERETLIQAQPIQASDQKVDEIRGTRETRIRGNNVSDHRRRVQRVG